MNAKFTSTDVALAVEGLVTTLMGVPPAAPQHQAAVRWGCAEAPYGLADSSVTRSPAAR